MPWSIVSFSGRRSMIQQGLLSAEHACRLRLVICFLDDGVASREARLAVYGPMWIYDAQSKGKPPCWRTALIAALRAHGARLGSSAPSVLISRWYT
jgi:hypothetical protein